MFGPLLAGAALAAFGTAACFGLNGLSFLVVIVALMSLHIKHIQPAEPKPMLQEMKGGLALRAERAGDHRADGARVL